MLLREAGKDADIVEFERPDASEEVAGSLKLPRDVADSLLALYVSVRAALADSEIDKYMKARDELAKDVKELRDVLMHEVRHARLRWTRAELAKVNASPVDDDSTQARKLYVDALQSYVDSEEELSSVLNDKTSRGA
jgi:hypothetical protein